MEAAEGAIRSLVLVVRIQSEHESRRECVGSGADAAPKLRGLLCAANGTVVGLWRQGRNGLWGLSWRVAAWFPLT